MTSVLYGASKSRQPEQQAGPQVALEHKEAFVRLIVMSLYSAVGRQLHSRQPARSASTAKLSSIKVAKVSFEQWMQNCSSDDTPMTTVWPQLKAQIETQLAEALELDQLDLMTSLDIRGKRITVYFAKPVGIITR